MVNRKLSVRPQNRKLSENFIKSSEIAKKKRVEEYNKTPALCRLCNSSLPYDKRFNKFCNSSCSAKKANSERKWRPTGSVSYKNACLECGTPTNNPKFCSGSCQHTYAWTQKLPRIQEGKGSSGEVRKYLIETFGHTCAKCKLEEWNDLPIPLELEHKDGNSDNNLLENVEMLCPNCHAQTPTYKGKNKGKGRWKRRQRYADGKSF